MLSWHIITRNVYDDAVKNNAAALSSDKLFFLSNTKEIYRGTENFTEAIILYDTEPTVKAVGKLYVNSTTLEGKIWNGTSWTTVIQPVQAAIIKGDTTKPISSKAVEDYVADQIAGVTGSKGIVAGVGYTAATNTLNVNMADGSTKDILMSNIAVDLVYEAETGLLQVKNAAGEVLGEGINLDLERFIKEASYDPETDIITLTFNDETDPLEINVAGLVDTYTSKNSSTIALTVTNNEFVAEAIVSSAADNILKVTENGLYVAAVDISGKVDKVSNATKDAVAILDANGGIVDSKITIGGSTIGEGSASVLATEAAIVAIRTALNESINGKMKKVAAGNEGKFIIADANGDAALSDLAVGGATFAENLSDKTLATEKGAAAYANAAVESALTWKTTI